MYLPIDTHFTEESDYAIADADSVLQWQHEEENCPSPWHSNE